VHFIGTAGWSITRPLAHEFDGAGTHLQRYARRFRCTEINSSFHRPHAAATYAKWAAATPADFRFAVKLPRVITHELKLERAMRPLDSFLVASAALGRKRGPLLVQLPPSLAFDGRIAATFFERFRRRYAGPLVCEPRHETWLGRKACAVLVRYRVARVAADPPAAPGADEPGGWPGLMYLRLHGSPRTYWSSYDIEFLQALAQRMGSASAQTDSWCIFDNTAAGAALGNARVLTDLCV